MLRALFALVCLLALALPVAADCACQPCDCKLCDCDDSYQQAVKQNKPLLIFVRQPARPVEGCLSVRVEVYPGLRMHGIVIALPDGKGGLVEGFCRDGYYPTTAWLACQVKELRTDQEKLACRGLFLKIAFDLRLGHRPRGHCR